MNPEVKQQVADEQRGEAQRDHISQVHPPRGSDGRGSQQPPVARFAVPAGKYRIETRFSSGFVQVKEIALGATPRRVIVDDEMPAVK